jgi:hypothetical protein
LSKKRDLDLKHLFLHKAVAAVIEAFEEAFSRWSLSKVFHSDLRSTGLALSQVSFQTGFFLDTILLYSAKQSIELAIV